MSKIIKKLIIIIVVILLAGAGYVFIKSFTGEQINSDLSFGQRIKSVFGLGRDSAPDSESGNSGQRVYTHPVYGFTFESSELLNISSFQEGEYGEIILARSDEDESKVFQIFVSPFDEPGPITKERILQDLPDMAIDEPLDVIIGQNNIQALIFWSNELSLGKTREVWFINSGYLYQITTRAELDGWVGKILETLRFQEKS